MHAYVHAYIHTHIKGTHTHAHTHTRGSQSPRTPNPSTGQAPCGIVGAGGPEMAGFGSLGRLWGNILRSRGRRVLDLGSGVRIS